MKDSDWTSLSIYFDHNMNTATVPQLCWLVTTNDWTSFLIHFDHNMNTATVP